MTNPQPSPALSADVVARMVADRAAGTPGPWRADGPVWNQIIWTDSENRLCFMAHSNGLNDDRDIANARRIARLPDLEAGYLALAAELAEREKELARVTAERDSAVITQAWTAGEPPNHIRNEWFIAKTIHGGRVVLRALPEDHSYDYTTKDETYMVAKNITHWMQFPDSNYVSFVPADYDALRASEAAALERESDMRQALQAAMDDIPGWYDLARDARNASLSARTQRMIARAAITPTADKEPKT